VVQFEENAARALPAGSLLIVDVYASPMGKPVGSQLRIALTLTGAPPAHPRQALTIATDDFSIASEDPRALVEMSRSVDRPMRLIALRPYMRSRGREMVVEAHPPDGRPARTLLRLDRYDPRWILRYQFSDPIDLPAGTRLLVRCVLDNSAANHANRDHTRIARSGPGADDEAVLLGVEWEAP
jgi:hypothetical protein